MIYCPSENQRPLGKTISGSVIKSLSSMKIISNLL